MKSYKERAIWIPKTKLFIRQILVSIFSYLTLPLFKEKKDGVQKFFKKNYYVEPDTLVFDGTSSGYLSRINYLADINVLSQSTIVDLGCGQGTFYLWMKENNIQVKQYIGVDFSIKAYTLNGRCSFKCDNIVNVGKYLSTEANTIVMCNSLCYIEDIIFTKILNELKPRDHIIIIEPSPNIFWDAHFDGVKPKYRKLEYVCLLLKRHGFVVECFMSDYLLKIGVNYISELSYGVCAFKK